MAYLTQGVESNLVSDQHYSARFFDRFYGERSFDLRICEIYPPGLTKKRMCSGTVFH